jgi:rubrerythrin
MNEKKVVAKLGSEHVGFLEACARFELKMAGLYHHFESLFADDLPFSLLWQKTAREEENHAQQFQLAVRLRGLGMEKVNTDVAQAMVALQKLEAYLDQLCSSRPSPEEALTRAIQLEEQLARLHMSSIVTFEDPELKKMFTAMMGSDEGHVSMLKEALSDLTSGR